MNLHGLLETRIRAHPLQPLLELFCSDGRTKRLVVVTLLLVLGSSAASGLLPLLAKLVIDALESNGAGAAYFAPLFLVAVYTVTSWLSRLLGELRNMHHGLADTRVQKQLSHKLFRHVMSLPLRFHLDRSTGAICQTLTNGLMGYRILLHHLMLTALPVVVELTAMGVVLMVLGHTVFLSIISVSVLLYATVFWVGVTRIGKPAQAVSNAHIDANAVLTDSILNYETVKYFVADAQVHARYIEALSKAEDEWAELFKRKMQNGLAVAGIFALSLGVSMFLAVLSVQEGNMTVGDFVLVNAYILQITRPLEMIGFAFRDVAQGIAFVEKMSELLRHKPELDPSNDVILSADSADLAFEHVSFSYHPDCPVLSDITFVVPSGKTTAIVGASGSGKSSLIRLLLRLVEPTEGNIYLNQVSVTDIPASILRSAVAVVPQDVVLFNASIAYNIAFGKLGSTREDIIRAAKVAHIHDFVVGLPDSYETKVGERGLKLSGGEKQRIAIARAAINQPKIFVFDEATSSLDTKTEQAILHDLRTVTSTTSTLVIAHRLSTVVQADEIVVLQQGRIIERGTHLTLLERFGAYSMMWRAQNDLEQILQDDASFA